MPGIFPIYKEGPLTYEVAVPVQGGQLLTADPTETGKLRPATADSTFIVGVAATDARPANDTDQSYTTPSGYPAHDASVPPPTVAVHSFGHFELLADGAIAFGESVRAAAGGRISKAGAGPVIGVCVNPQGAASGERALIRLQMLGPYTAPAEGGV